MPIEQNAFGDLHHRFGLNLFNSAECAMGAGFRDQMPGAFYATSRYDAVQELSRKCSAAVSASASASASSSTGANAHGAQLLGGASNCGLEMATSASDLFSDSQTTGHLRSAKQSSTASIRANSETRSTISRASYMCRKCKAHGVSIAVKQHKKECRFFNCKCRKCQLVEKGRRVVAKQIALYRDQKFGGEGGRQSGSKLTRGSSRSKSSNGVNCMDLLEMGNYGDASVTGTEIDVEAGTDMLPLSLVNRNSAQPLSFESGPGDSTRLQEGPHCRRCRNHNVSVTWRGHKKNCPFRECTCPPCKLINERKDTEKTLRDMDKLLSPGSEASKGSGSSLGMRKTVNYAEELFSGRSAEVGDIAPPNAIVGLDDRITSRRGGKMSFNGSQNGYPALQGPEDLSGYLNSVNPQGGTLPLWGSGASGSPAVTGPKQFGAKGFPDAIGEASPYAAATMHPYQSLYNQQNDQSNSSAMDGMPSLGGTGGSGGGGAASNGSCCHDSVSAVAMAAATAAAMVAMAPTKNCHYHYHYYHHEYYSYQQNYHQYQVRQQPQQPASQSPQDPRVNVDTGPQLEASGTSQAGAPYSELMPLASDSSGGSNLSGATYLSSSCEYTTRSGQFGSSAGPSAPEKSPDDTHKSPSSTDGPFWPSNEASALSLPPEHAGGADTEYGDSISGISEGRKEPHEFWQQLEAINRAKLAANAAAAAAVAATSASSYADFRAEPILPPAGDDEEVGACENQQVNNMSIPRPSAIANY